MEMSYRINPAVIELLELAKLDSPFSKHLVDLHRKRLVKKLLNDHKIDSEMASYLRE